MQKSGANLDDTSVEAETEVDLSEVAVPSGMADPGIEQDKLRPAGRASLFDPEAWLPPLLPWKGASELLIADATDPWITPSELGGLEDTPCYDESMTWLSRLCAESRGLLSMTRFGHSAQGRSLFLVVAAKGLDHFPESLRASGRPTVLIQAGIHPGEIEGKDAGMMLLRDIAFGGKGELLEKANLLFIPILNPDGHERASRWNRPNQRGPRRMGWRTTAQNLNLNRDYVKADAPEMRALLKLFNTWPVDLYLDIHATDGLDYQYDFTYAYHGRDGGPAWSPQISRWIDQSLSPALDAELRRQGHLPLNFYVVPVDKRDLRRGLREGHMSPRFSHGYGDLRHLPTVLVETHSLKPYRQRVLATRVFLEAAIRHAGSKAEDLLRAISADRARRAVVVPLEWSQGGAQRQVDFQGIDFELQVSVATGKQEVRWLGSPRVFRQLPVFVDRVGRTIERPKRFWVPAWKTEVIEKLRLHGIIMDVLVEEEVHEVTMYRVVCDLPPTTIMPEEGRFPVHLTDVKPERRWETFPAGSVRVSTDQPLGDLAIMLLEPMGADSLLRWGFFNEILHRTEYIEGYVMAPLAERMLAEDGGLRARFAAKLAADPDFAANAEARMHWFYERTPFYDGRFLLYPVGVG